MGALNVDTDGQDGRRGHSGLGRGSLPAVKSGGHPKLRAFLPSPISGGEGPGVRGDV
jgi:hypothetical protein